jgi:murein DD-endopeptidase MepM/ murein hydrolase activator NlpD
MVFSASAGGALFKRVARKPFILIFVWSCCLGAAPAGHGQLFQLPTINHALFEPGGEERFLVGTVGKPYTSGRFGCVRSDGHQLHEGLDIKCVQRDRHGEPIDHVTAAADGTVVYFNSKPALSNYGKYVVLRHRLEGLEIYTLYAHLSEIRSDLHVGATVKQGEMIAIMGHTANTHQGITKDRAHVHFEIDLLVNERFPAWYHKTFPDQRNDHGEWNGLNLLGLDARLILLNQASAGPTFSLLHFIHDQAELCRVLVRNASFPWLHRYTSLLQRNPAAEREGAAAYEISLNYNGVPFRLIPRAPSEVRPGPKFQLLSVNEAEEKDHPCGKLVTHAHGRWELTGAGSHLLDQLTF